MAVIESAEYLKGSRLMRDLGGDLTKKRSDV